MEHGRDILKLFPAEVVGGIKALKAYQSPLSHALFCPTGGITYDNAPHYLAQPNVICVGASWLVPPKPWPKATGTT